MFILQAVLEVLSESQLPRCVLSVVIQLAASLILVSPCVPECRAHLSQLVKGVCDGERSVKEEGAVEMVLTFFQELAQKYSGFEYVCKGGKLAHISFTAVANIASM